MVDFKKLTAESIIVIGLIIYFISFVWSIEKIYVALILIIIFIAFSYLIISKWGLDKTQKIMAFGIIVTLSFTLWNLNFSQNISKQIEERPQPNINVTHLCFQENNSFGENFNTFVNQIHPNVKSISITIQIPKVLNPISNKTSPFGMQLKPNNLPENTAIGYSWEAKPASEIDFTVVYETNPNFITAARTFIYDDGFTKPYSILFDCQNRKDWINR